MMVVAEYPTAQPFRPQEIMRFLRRHEDYVFIASLFILIAATFGIALLVGAALTNGAANGVCFQRAPAFPAHLFLMMH
jgi:hypothetical protein